MRSEFSLRNLKISHVLIIIFLIFSLLINGVITFSLYQAASKQVMQDIERRLFDIVSISSKQIDGDLHSRLLTLARQDPSLSLHDSETYLKLKQDLKEIRDASSDIHFIYTMRTTDVLGDTARMQFKYGGPRIMFVVDAEEDPTQTAQLGEVYSDAGPLLSKRFFDMKDPVIEKTLYQDQWGTWLSGYAPFYDSNGRRAGVLGVDISAETVAQYQNHILSKSLVIFLMTLPVVVAAALLLGRWIGSPMGMMQRGAEAIASGYLDHRLEIPMGRELSVLAKSMNHMAQSLQQEQKNLERMVIKYRNIFENAVVGIYQSTSEGQLLAANSAMVKMLGYDSPEEMQEAVGQHIGRIYESQEDRRKIIRQLKEQRRLTSAEVRLKRKDGSGFPAELSVHLCDYGESQGEETVIEGTMMDISQRIEREEAEREKEAALASSNAKSEFLANMSHEIRTPLNAVMGLTDLMGRTELSDTQQQYLKKITISSRSLLAVINDILDFSKIEAGRLALEHAPFSLYDLMANVSEMFAYKADEKGLEFLLSIDEHTPTAVIGDAVRLGQVLINLVGNAMKFTEQGEIVVKVTFSKKPEKKDDMPNGAEALKPLKGTEESENPIETMDGFTFLVEDTGIGIPEDRLDALFESFTQADGSTTRKYGGTGLGLTISRRLVRLMGGDIVVTSTPGIGSAFSFTIPLERQPEKNQITLHPPRDLRGLKVLIVDDNRTSLDILTGVIQSFHMEAVTASSGEEALDVLMNHTASTPFDLVLMDWKMPQMSGLEAARRIKLEMALDKTPIVCMVSAHAREDLIQKADRKFLDAFLYKPVNQSFLFDTIMELFGRHDALVSKSPSTSYQVSKTVLNKMFKGKRVLLVEDNEINREVALEWLSSSGIEVDMAHNGEEALSYFGISSDLPASYEDKHSIEESSENNSVKGSSVLPDAVLMDIQMPEMDGLEATGHIRKDLRFQSLPIIAMTAHALKGDREKCLNAGMDDYVTKPIDPALLFQILAKWTGAVSEAPEEPSATNSEHPLEQSEKTAAPSNLSYQFEQSNPSSQSPLFEIPGIDVPKGLFRANHNRKLFHKLIKSFARDFANAEDEIQSYLAMQSRSGTNGINGITSDSIENARLIVHSVKGVSANIGAEVLSAVAADLEQAIVADRDSAGEKSVPNEIWQPFCWELNNLLSGIRDHISVTEGDALEKNSPSTNGKTGEEQNSGKEKEDGKGVEFDGGSVQNSSALDIEALLKTLDRVDAMLDDDLGAARDLLESVESDLKIGVGFTLCGKLMDAMDDFEIDDASETIQQMIDILSREIKAS